MPVLCACMLPASDAARMSAAPKRAAQRIFARVVMEEEEVIRVP